MTSHSDQSRKDQKHWPIAKEKMGDDRAFRSYKEKNAQSDEGYAEEECRNSFEHRQWTNDSRISSGWDDSATTFAAPHLEAGVFAVRSFVR